jgi:PPOX class probable F420-dependent enzyme
MTEPVSRQGVPRAERPIFPDGYGVPDTLDGLLPWRHADERLERAKIYWIATTRPDGRPHVSPIWGVWLDNTLFFDGSPQARRSRNLAARPHVAAHLDSGGEGKDVVVLEGTSGELCPPPELAARLAAAYAAKYRAENYAPEPTQWDNGGLYAVRPRVVIAWTDLPTATRWRFD